MKHLRPAFLIMQITVLAVLLTVVPGASAQNSGGAAVPLAESLTESLAESLAAPVIHFNHPLYGSVFNISLFGAPPRSAVVFYKSEADGSYVEELGRRQTDFYGVTTLDHPLTDPAWVDRDLVIWAEIIPSTGPAMTTKRMEVKASNPSFYMPCMAPDGSGFIARYDEIEGVVRERVDMEGGVPVRILFSRDGNLGFVLLDSGQIGVFDPFTDQWLSWFQAAGSGILDIAVTPDGTRVAVLGRDQEEAPGLDLPGKLWIYDLERGVGAPPDVITIDSVNPTGEGRILVMGDDLPHLYVRSGKSAVDEVNYETGEYRPLKLNDQLPYSTVRDIQIFKNCLAVLLTLPDETGFVCVRNTQNDRCGIPVPVGRNPVTMDVFEGETGPLAAALCRSEDGAADVIRFVHLYEQRVVGAISGLIPPGVRDLAVNDLRDDGVILYIPRGGAAGKGYVGFFDRRTLRLKDEYAVVPVDAGSRILLSRSPLVNRCYIWTRRGIISVIDLDSYTRIDKIDLDAESLASPAENT